jgi:metal-responsive CopG/Arc/MetJ family transcriptional regulator
MSETTVQVSLDDRVLSTLDKLAAVGEESRSEMAARLIAAGIAHKGFVIPPDVPC